MSSKRGEDRRVPLRAASPSRNARGERGASTPARIAAVAAVLIAFAVVVVLLFGGGDGVKYTLMFQTGGQLVPGNQVLVAGQPVGTVDSIDLTDDNQAAIAVTMQQPLREGTTALIRTTSLSGVANRYISLTPGPNNAPEIEPDSTISGDGHDLPGRHRPALQHLPGPRARGAAEVHRGQRHRLCRQGRARQPRLQVPQPGPQHLDPAVHRALQRLGGALPLPRLGLADVPRARRPP